jgi:hypothetical protein
MINWPHGFEPVVRKHIMAGPHGRKNSYNDQEAKKKEIKRPSPTIPCKCTPPVT